MKEHLLPWEQRRGRSSGQSGAPAPEDGFWVDLPEQNTFPPIPHQLSPTGRDGSGRTIRLPTGAAMTLPGENRCPDEE